MFRLCKRCSVNLILCIKFDAIFFLYRMHIQIHRIYLLIKRWTITLLTTSYLMKLCRYLIECLAKPFTSFSSALFRLSIIFPPIALTVLVQDNNGSELNFNGWTVQFNSLTLCRDFLAFLGCLFFFQILLNQIILSWFNWFSILYCFCHIIFSVI